MLERLMDMVVVFEQEKNFFWVYMLVLHVIYWEGIDRLELTRQGAFSNNELAKLIRQIRDRLHITHEDKSEEKNDWPFWLRHPPYLQTGLQIWTVQFFPCKFLSKGENVLGEIKFSLKVAVLHFEGSELKRLEPLKSTSNKTDFVTLTMAILFVCFKANSDL